jgi:hypothetical protein
MADCVRSDDTGHFGQELPAKDLALVAASHRRSSSVNRSLFPRSRAFRTRFSTSKYSMASCCSRRIQPPTVTTNNIQGWIAVLMNEDSTLSRRVVIERSHHKRLPKEELCFRRVFGQHGVEAKVRGKRVPHTQARLGSDA